MKRNTPTPPAAAAMEAERRQPMAGEQGHRQLSFTASSYNAATHSVEAVLSAGTAVNRYYFTEELEISPDAVDLNRVAAGLCRLLDTHNQYEIDAVLGGVSNVRIENGLLLATLTFGQTENAARAEGMVSRGELTGISIGYMVHQWTLARTDPETSRETWRATRWELTEVSLVPVPADASAGVRSAPGMTATPGNGAAAAQQEEEEMTRNLPGGAAAPAPAASAASAPAAAPAAEENRAAAPAAAPAPAAAAPVVEETRAAPAAGQEAERFTPADGVAFVDQARSLGVEQGGRELVTAIAAGSTTPSAARARLLELAAERQSADTATTRGGPSVAVNNGNEEASRAAVSDALAARVLRTAPSEAGREYMGQRLLELAAQRAGINPRERDYAVIMRAAMTTSDFPIILENVANRVLLARYAAAMPTYRAIARQRDLTDFKATNLLRIGDFPMLQEFQEDGEIKYGSINEGKESVVLGSYGRNIRLSRQAIINDDLNAFDDVINGISRMISRFENSTFYTMKSANGGAGPLLSDGKALFHADHGNLAGAGAAIAVNSVGAGRAAMRKQTDLDGAAINVAPRTMLVGPDKETLAEQFLAPIAAVQQAEINPFASKLQLVTDALHTGNSWELYADPNEMPVFHFGFLADAPGPRVLTQEGFDYDGLAWSVRMDFYAGATDYRGAWRNPGA